MDFLKGKIMHSVPTSAEQKRYEQFLDQEARQEAARRLAAEHEQHTAQRDAHTERRSADRQPRNAVRALLDDAKRQSGERAFYNQDGTLRHVVKEPAAASVASLNLRELTVPAFLDGQGMHRSRSPLGESAGKVTTFSSALLLASRAHQAGAHIILVDEAPDAIQQPNGEIAWKRRNARFDVIEAATFAMVADGANVADSALPVYRAMIDVDTMPSYGFRVPLSRADQKAYEGGQLEDATLVSIALGIARAADAALLSAIAASTPATFSLGAAAALGIEFAELRALVGTTGTGAAVGQDGTLRAAGVLAELTADTSATIVGAFNRAAVAVHADIRLVAERVNLHGELVLTCWINLQPLLPLPGAFWSVGA
ncbi:hypothetical protein [Azotobacter salinestris]|uniref:hypothetical protein n=1 Tax=Azotobacter salinestris TaxID=69964 RepID=UPI0032DF1F77